MTKVIKDTKVKNTKTTKDTEAEKKETKEYKLRGRRFFITLNQCDKFEELKENMMSKKNLAYMVAYDERGHKTGHEHIHIMLHFSNPTSLTNKNCCNANMQIQRGTNDEAFEYASKDGKKLFEFGEPIHQGKQLTGEDIKKMTYAEIAEADPLHFGAYSKAKAAMSADLDIDDIEKKVKVYYIYGPSGVGKTTKAKEIIRQYKKDTGNGKYNTVKFSKDFWIGTGEAKVALYDDFRDSHMPASEFINFIDYNKQIMNIKNGQRINEYELIIITSIQNPYKLYKNLQFKDSEPRKQWLRRMEIIKLEPKKITDDTDSEEESSE